MKPSSAIAVLLAACGSPPSIPGSRFVNAPPATVVNDRRDVPHQPDEREWLQILAGYDGVVQRPLDRALDVQRSRRALGVNALDEVPDSTWFTNRIGVRDMTLAEVIRGPLTIETPELHKPWKIKSGKSGGAEAGFVVEDARGIKFLLKFDIRGFPEQETSTDIIVGRLLWASGYNVPEDFIVDLQRDDLVLASDAKYTDQFGDKHPLDRALVERQLSGVETAPDGRIRGYLSRWIDGKPLGGHPDEGVRPDDPNDRIPHELRRDLRGAYAIFSWLDHEDVTEGNFLDTWVADRADPKHHYVKHYMLDFGKSLGVMASTAQRRRFGHSYVIDLREMALSLFSAGLYRRPWEGRSAPRLRGVGLYEARSYDPGAWKSVYPWYRPFLETDRFDNFWGAKILMRFTREQLHAVVESSRLSDPRAVEYITDTLVARQRATGAYWFARVNPLDRFAVSDDQLCFDDLAIHHRFTPASTTSYQATRYDRDDRVAGTLAARPDHRGHACIPAALAAGTDGYTIIRLTTTRPAFTGSTLVHLARDPATGAPRVIGIWRE